MGMLRITPSVSANRTEIARMTPRQSAIRIEQVRGSNVILRRGVRVMDQSPEELKQKAARYRELARQVFDEQAADRILALARELERQAQQQQ